MNSLYESVRYGYGRNCEVFMNWIQRLRQMRNLYCEQSRELIFNKGKLISGISFRTHLCPKIIYCLSEFAFNWVSCIFPNKFGYSISILSLSTTFKSAFLAFGPLHVLFVLSGILYFELLLCSPYYVFPFLTLFDIISLLSVSPQSPISWE